MSSAFFSLPILGRQRSGKETATKRYYTLSQKFCRCEDVDGVVDGDGDDGSGNGDSDVGIATKGEHHL